MVLDEVQRCPHLLSYLQVAVDENPQVGRFVLTGSQQFGLLAGITQSLAGRIGQLLNLSQSAAGCGITHNTARAWISILEAGYVVFLLQPQHRSFNKRLIKTPNWLLSIRDAEQLGTHALRGATFEGFVFSSAPSLPVRGGARSSRDRSTGRGPRS